MRERLTVIAIWAVSVWFAISAWMLIVEGVNYVFRNGL